MEAETTLVRPQCRGVLHTVATVHTQHTLVIDPRHTELDDTLGLHHIAEHRDQRHVSIEYWLQVLHHLVHCLNELFLVRVAALDDILQRCNRLFSICHCEIILKCRPFDRHVGVFDGAADGREAIVCKATHLARECCCACAMEATAEHGGGGIVFKYVCTLK